MTLRSVREAVGWPPPYAGRTVGRQAELEIIGRRLDVLRGAKLCGGAGFIEIGGEPGIGKSRLLGEIGWLATDRGQVVASGRATEADRTVPFGVLAEALDDHLAALEPAAGQRLCADWLEPLAEVFPALQPWWRARTPRPDSNGFRSCQAVRALLETLAESAESAGLVVLLDDVHWADPASVKLLVHLLRHPPRAPVLVAMSYRVGQLPAALGAALAEGVHSELVQRLELGPLPLQATAELLGRPVEQCRMLHEQSGGNPLYLQLLAYAGAQESNSADCHRCGELDTILVTNLRCALFAELDALVPTRRLVAQAAAVVGDLFNPELVAPVAAMDTAETMAALDDLIARDLIRTVEGGRRFRFRHPLVRQLIYSSAGAGWCTAAHARLAAVLAQRSAPIVTRAPHVALAAQPGDENAIALLPAAAEVAVADAPATAAEWLRTTLRLMPTEAVTAPQRLRLQLRLTDALIRSGQLEAGQDALTAAVLLMPVDSPVLRVTVSTVQARLQRLRGRYPQARAVLHAELDVLSQFDSQLDPVQTADLLFELAGSAELDGDSVEARRWALRAVATAQNHDRPLHAAALALLARTTACHANPQRARALLTEAKTVLDGLLDAALIPRLEAIAWVGWAELLFDRYDAAAQHFARGRALAERSGQHHVHSWLLLGLASAHGTFGRLDEATELTVAAVEAAELTGSAELLAIALGMRCWFACWAGDLDTARAAGRQAMRVARTATGTALVSAQVTLAHLHLIDGDPARCVSDVLRAGGGPGLPHIHPLTRATWYEVLVRAESTQRRRVQAGNWADRAQAIAAEVGVPGQVGVARLARAQALLDADPLASAACAGAAAKVFTELGDRLRAGRAHLLAGQALTVAEKPDEAGRELERARLLFVELRAVRLRAEAAHGLRQLGQRIFWLRGGSDQVVEPNGLTIREWEVASLVARGYSNREIAEELVVSVRTVTTHMSHIFAKLGVSSRTAIAAAWAKLPAD